MATPATENLRRSGLRGFARAWHDAPTCHATTRAAGDTAGSPKAARAELAYTRARRSQPEVPSAVQLLMGVLGGGGRLL